MHRQNKIALELVPTATQIAYQGIQPAVVDFTTKVFSDGSVMAQITEGQEGLINQYQHIRAIAYIDCMDDLMVVAQLKEVIDRKHPNLKVSLNIISPAYTRYDRVMLESGLDSFGLECYAKFINALEFDQVLFFDAHSEVTTDLIKGSNSISMLDTAWVLFPQEDLCSKFTSIVPDKGALKKNPHAPIVFNKTRNLEESGAITKYELVKADATIELPNDFLVLDDICDGGRTFLLLAERFRELYPTANSLNLYITHGIFSHGAIPKLLSLYDTIYVAVMKESVYNTLTDLEKAKLKVSVLITGV